MSRCAGSFRVCLRLLWVSRAESSFHAENCVLLLGCLPVDEQLAMVVVSVQLGQILFARMATLRQFEIIRDLVRKVRMRRARFNTGIKALYSLEILCDAHLRRFTSEDAVH